MEVWVWGGREFSLVAHGGLGDQHNTEAETLVFADRLILVAGNQRGMQIFVSEDGERFERVVEAGLGDPGNLGSSTAYHFAEDEGTVFEGCLYLGTSNPSSGGEMWRTADGLRWERVVDRGLRRRRRVALRPALVFRAQLYVIGTNRSKIDAFSGLDVFRSGDGLHWERVVADGFATGLHRGTQGSLTEFGGAALPRARQHRPPGVRAPGSRSSASSRAGFGSTARRTGRAGLRSARTASATRTPSPRAASSTVTSTT